jgi:exodeoxyribonuclease VIII
MKLIKDNQLTHDCYYQDTEYVSNSMLSHLTGKSPEYFRFAMDNPQPSTPAMKFGSALHMNVLQPEEFSERYAISPKFDKRTKQGKIDAAEFVKANMFKTVITEEEYHLVEQMTDKLMRDPDAKALLTNGDKEQIIAWENEEYGVKCRGMLDVFNRDANIIVDLKTTQDSSYNGFASSVRKYKYYKQAAFYMDAVRANEFYIVAIEKSPPFSINIIQLSDDLLDKGRELYNRDLEVYKYCMDNDYWPGIGFDYLDKKSERSIHIMSEDIL